MEKHKKPKRFETEREIDLYYDGYRAGFDAARKPHLEISDAIFYFGLLLIIVLCFIGPVSCTVVYEADDSETTEAAGADQSAAR